MSKKLTRKGAVLPLIVVLLLVIVLIGLFAVGVLQLLEAGREVHSAADAGGLNVARVAVVAPTIRLNPDDPTFGSIDKTIQSLVLDGKATVNLLNFNRIVAWGLMVAINADADGSPEAIDTARKVWMRIEGDPKDSIGAQLKEALSSKKTQIESTAPDIPTGPWPSTVFNATAQRNPTFLANPKEILTWQSFETGYLGPGDSTNVSARPFLEGLPYTDLGTLTRYNIKIPTTEDGYVQGYAPIVVGKTGITYYFVTVYRKLTPGLRTIAEFETGKEQPGSGIVALPPNTFFNHATILVTKTNSTISAGSPATVGCKPYEASCSLPGYFLFHNGPAQTYDGPMPVDKKTAVDVSVPGLTANEFAKNILVRHYLNRDKKGNSGPLIFKDVTSGLGQYHKSKNPIATPNQSLPWGTSGVYTGGIDEFGEKFCCAGAKYVYPDLYGKITDVGLNPGDAVTQTTASNYRWLVDGADQGTATEDPLTIAYNYFVQRCMQLGAEKEDIDYVWQNLYLDLEDSIYVWVNDTANMIVSRDPPADIPELPQPGGGLDSITYAFQTSYDLLKNVVNTANDYNIKDRMFEEVCTPGQILSHDSVMLEPGTGALGCTGRMYFQEIVNNGASGPPSLCKAAK